jgi:V/A-type H+-transporting ATPase subunit K
LEAKIMSSLLFLLPAAFLIVSVIIAIRAVKNGKKPRKAFLTQILAFAVVCVVTFAIPVIASATSTDQAASKPTTSESASASDSGKGLGLLAATLATGLSGIGGGIAVGSAAPAAIGATSEDPKNFGKALIFVALGEGVALYGLLISILVLGQI